MEHLLLQIQANSLPQEVAICLLRQHVVKTETRHEQMRAYRLRREYVGAKPQRAVPRYEINPLAQSLPVRLHGNDVHPTHVQVTVGVMFSQYAHLANTQISVMEADVDISAPGRSQPSITTEIGRRSNASRSRGFAAWGDR
jgi:hypothetical protein